MLSHQRMWLCKKCGYFVCHVLARRGNCSDQGLVPRVYWTRMRTQKQPPSTRVNSLRPRQDGRHFPDDIFECIFLNKNVCLSIVILLKFVFWGPINNIPALVQIMAWRRPGDKPLSEPMMVSLLTHICVTRPQWVKQTFHSRKAFTV